MEIATYERDASNHDRIRDQYDSVQLDGVYEEGLARMSVYHQYCQDPVIFRTIGELSNQSLLDLACGDGFYTRKFRKDGRADPVIGIDLSPKAIERARAIERRRPLGIEYHIGDAVQLRAQTRRFDRITAIHLLHYLQSREEIAAVLSAVYQLLKDDGKFTTMIANPEFSLDKHDPSDSKSKFGYYFSRAEPGNGGRLRFHPGGFEPARELTFELRRWERGFLNEIARDIGFLATWHEPFISDAGLEQYGADYFANYLANPQSKLLRLTKRR